MLPREPANERMCVSAKIVGKNNVEKKTELIKYRGKERCRKEKRSKIKCRTK
jgi:hypothetical protein